MPSSLRGKLIAQLIALLSVVCLVVGVVTEVALRQFLVHQLDVRLAAANERVREPPPDMHFSTPNAPPPDFLKVPGLGAETLGMLIDADGSVRSGVIRGTPHPGSGDFPSDPLSGSQQARLVGLPPDGKIRTVDLGDPLDSYRVVSQHLPKGAIRILGLPMRDITTTLWQLGFVFGGVALGGLLLAGTVGAITIRRTMRPLERLARTAAQVSEIQLDKGEVALSVRVREEDTDPRTEVGKVGAAFNRMLEHVAAALSARQASESRVRQFVADASHELRTPLASIRGYAELIRRSGDAVPPDIAFAMGRVEAESARMTTLVEDLLLLARLDAGRRRVHEPVDLSRLIADAVSDAHVAGGDHRWLLDVPAEPITVLGDPDQLHQVVINLLNNARTHTPPGTVVTTKLAETGGLVTLTVMDNGPGIPKEVLPEVFERFARGDNSRSRVAGSTGLGLAIVAAVVSAHNGQVGVSSEPGRTEVIVCFPAFSPAAHFAPVGELRNSR